MLRLLIIDDEPLARQKLRQLLDQHTGIQIVGEAGSVPEALKLIGKEKPDAIFLDIQMKESDGFSLLRSLEHPPQVVFVTAHAGHAVQAFDVQAVDYLLKPVRPARLSVALERLRSKSPSEAVWQTRDRICFKTPGRTLIAEPGVIVALEADGDFTNIFIVGERPVMICHNLSYYEKILPSPPFLRLDRSLMINLDRIKKLEADGNDHEKLTLSGVEKTFLLGRAAHRRLSQALSEDS
jgi:two-component system, LytTR family, response regulator